MYRNHDHPTPTGDYTPCQDIQELRAILFDAMCADTQQPFHHLQASRTPREWVERELEIANAVAMLEPHRPMTEGPWAAVEPPHYCPACGSPVPVLAGLSSHPVALHILGIQQPACAVIGEVLHWFRTTIRPEKFSEEAIVQAQDAFNRARPKLAAPPEKKARAVADAS